MKSKLVTDNIEVGNRLDDLGWRREDLLEVIDRMVGARNSCTANDPPSAPGWKSWCDGTRRLREIGAGLGWERNNDDFISSICDRKRGTKIAVCNTDAGTGLNHQQPQNQNRKGAATDRAVSINQSVFGDILEDALNVIQLPGDSAGAVYWYLCVYSDGDVVRAELSCPSECENGFFKEFRERIILLTGEGDESGIRVRPPLTGPESEFDIEVIRKKAP